MNRNNKRKTTKTPLQIAIIVLSAILLINIVAFVGLVVDDFGSYRPDEESILYTIKQNDFTWLRYQIGQYSTEEIAKSETLSEAYAINAYFESSFYYHAYAKTDPDAAAHYQAEMAQNAQDAGALAFYVTEIDALFEDTLFE